MIVVDASAIIDVILGRPKAAAIVDRLFETDEDVVAPHLIESEVVHLLRKLWRANVIREEEAIQAVTLFDRLAIRRASTPNAVRPYGIFVTT